MNIEELKASKMLLDLGVSIPVRRLGFFGKKPGKRTVTVRQPYAGGIIRISSLYHSIGVSIAELEKYTPDENIAFIAKHGKTISLIVACALVRSYLGFMLFGKIVAWWLRWRVHPVFMSEAVYQLMDNLNINPFKNTISAAEAINMMTPRLSHR